jgi:hypothetical protein
MNRRASTGPTLIGHGLNREAMHDLMRDSKPTCRREPPEIQLRRCPLNPRQWAPAGSLDAGRCLCCGVAFPSAQAA